MRLRSFLPVLLLGFSALAGAAAGSVNEMIKGAVTQFMEGYADDLLTRIGQDARVEFSLASLDQRLRLPLCSTPLSVEARQQTQLSARLNLQVSCTSGNGWSIYVPVELAVHRPVVSVTRPVGRGETLHPSDLALVEMDIARLTGQYLTGLGEAVGMETRRPLAQGATVIAEALEPPLLVRRGEAVMIQAAGQTIAVKMAGTAMIDGRRGQQIRVKNSSSGKIVAARVVAQGVVEVML